jgi:hypothetical protein
MPRPTPLKPQTLFQWASNVFAPKKAPPLQRKEQGWAANEKPPNGWLNWVFNVYGQWSNWLNDNFNDYGVSNNERVRFFGTGQDGDATISTEVSLTRDMHYENLTFATGGYILTNNWRVFVRDTLDMSAADAYAFNALRNAGAVYGNGDNGSPSGSVSTNTNAASYTLGTYNAGGNGGATSGPVAPSGTSNANGVGAGGAGGTGGTGSGGAGVAGVAGGSTVLTTRLAKINPSYMHGVTRTEGGTGGGYGGRGGYDGGSNSGSGGCGGMGGSVIDVRAYKIVRSSNAPAFYAKGGNGGAGGNPANVNRGSGGGGGGGGGGTVFILFADLDGNALTDAVDASGGDSGGSVGAANRNGSGGTGGKGGSITIINLAEQTITTVDGAAGSAGGAANQAGGVAAAGAGGAAKATF